MESLRLLNQLVLESGISERDARWLRQTFAQDLTPARELRIEGNVTVACVHPLGRLLATRKVLNTPELLELILLHNGVSLGMSIGLAGFG